MISVRTYRLLVTGPKSLDDLKVIKRILNYYTFALDSVVLVSNAEPDKEYHRDPSSFPLAEKWLRDVWMKGRKGYATIVRHQPPYKGAKKWGKGVEEMREAMVKDSHFVVAFLDVGSDDYHTQEIVRLARDHHVPLRKVLI